MSDVFLLPDPGEGLTEADIVAWKVAAGDTVTVNQILVEIETAKSLVELPSPQAGLIAELLVAEGDTVEVGSPIVRFGGEAGSAAEAGDGGAAGAVPAGSTAPAAEAKAGAEDEESSGATLVGYGAVGGSSKRRPRKQSAAPVGGAAGATGAAGTGGGATGTATVSSGESASIASAGPAAPAAVPTRTASGAASGTAPGAVESTGSANTAGSASTDAAGTSGARPLAKPPVRKLAKDRGVDLAHVPASGERGEVTRADLNAYLESGGAAGSAVGQGAAGTAGAQADADGRGGSAAPAAGPGTEAPREEQVPLKGVRKAMANAMVTSAFTAPHVTEGVEIDVTGMMDLVRTLKATRRLGAEVRVSPLLVIAKAVTWAAQRHPYMNARLDDDTITVRNYVNLGIAAATPRGLLVPNIKDAHTMGLARLAGELGELVETARAGRTSPAAQAGGTITVTNVGVFGVDWGTPIINPGEAAIVAVGRVVKKPWIVDDAVVPREVMTVTVSADHRVVDGETISMFLRDVADALEDPTHLLS